MQYRILCFTLIILFLAQSAAAEDIKGESSPLHRYFSPINRVESISFTPGIFSYELSNQRIISGSEKVYADSLTLKNEEDYLFDYQNGIITFKESMPPLKSVEVEYSIIPTHIYQRFSLFNSQEYSDTLKTSSLKKERLNLSFPDTDLTISGSKTFAVSVSNEEDFNISQSLFLRIDGEMRKNLYIQAQLSDSQSPLTPEGDTRELSSLDEIFIKIYGREYEIAFGDLKMELIKSQFINYTAKFEGLKAEWSGLNKYKGAIAISKGKQKSYEFKGKDGKQGPYYLTFDGQSANVQIVPGSEEVFLNGVSIERGSDYTIDYSEGSVTFTSKHFIDSNSQIYVRFQYSDENYRQNMYLASSEVELTDALKLTNNIILRSDDKDNPLLDSFSAEDVALLKAGGDGVVWSGGVNKVENQAGSYRLEITQDGREYYVYVGPNQGDYDVRFSYVGAGKGDYKQSGLDSFEYVGTSLGDWLPGRLLPSPEHLANYDMALNWEKEDYNISGELIVSQFDRNTLSDLDDEDNIGYGQHWQFDYHPENVRWEPSSTLFYRYLSKNLNTFSDIKQPDLDYDFYEMAQSDSSSSHEYGGFLSLNMNDFIIPVGKYWRKIAKNDYVRDNLLLQNRVNQRRFIPELNYRYFLANQRGYKDSSEELNTQQNQLSATYRLRPLMLTGQYFSRLYKEKKTNDELESFNYGTKINKKTVTLNSYDTKHYAGSLFLQYEDNTLLKDEKWRVIRESKGVGGEGFIDRSEQRVRLAYSRFEVAQKSEAANNYDVAEINLNNTFLKKSVHTSGNYILRNVEFYPKLRELIYVGKNAGVYDSTGVASSEGEYDYRTVQVGTPEMSVEINADFQLNINPRVYFSHPEDRLLNDSNTIKELLKRFQFDNYLSLSENSRAQNKWDVYLLKPSVIMSEEHSIYSRFLFKQTSWLDIVTGRVLGKVGYQNDKTMDNRYTDSFESRVESVETTLRLSKYLHSDFELSYENRQENESRYNSTQKNNYYALDVRNVLESGVQLSSKIFFNNETGDKSSGGSTYSMKSAGLTETLTFFFQRKYRLFSQVEYRNNRREGSDFLSFLPDKRNGNIFRWNTRLNYQLNSFTTATLEYGGNNYPLQKSVHKMKMEFRAEF